MRVEGVRLTAGGARGPLMVLRAPLSFYGGVNPDNGVIVQADHPDRGRCIRGMILALERSTGSTVGAWTLLRMARTGTAPAAILSRRADAVLITGTVTAGIPHLDGIEIPALSDGCEAIIPADANAVEIASVPERCEEKKMAAENAALPEVPLAAPDAGAIVKLGGSLLTFKSSPVPRVNESELQSMALLLATHMHFPAVLVHGAGSFGHGPVMQSGVLQRDLDAPARLQWGRIAALQYQLDAIVADALLEAGLPVWPLQASALGKFDENGELQIFIQPLQDALEQGFIPLLYGTVGFSCGQQRPVILSGDDLAPALALRLGFSRILHLTDAPGVCDRDPKLHADARVLPFIPASESVHFDPSAELHDATGAMSGKIQKLRGAARAGILSWIVDGRNHNAVRRAMAGLAAGTVVGPDDFALRFGMK